MKVMIKCSLVFVLFLIFCGTAMAEQNASGREGEPAGTNQAPRKIRITTALPDGDQPVMTDRESELSLKGPVNDMVLAQVPKAPIAYTPLWKGLDKLSLSDKENAIIQLEVPHDLPATWLKQVKEIEELWKSGNFDGAIEYLRSLEESEVIRDIAVGISWKAPRMISGTKLSTDVQIGARQNITKPCLDFHYDTGNLFAVLKRSDPTAWTVNLSTDGGQTWQETYAWNAGAGESAIDLDAAVVADYLYVGYVASNFPHEARMRRFFASDGSSDAAYGYQVVFDKDVDINEVALASNADSYDNRIYYWAILADHFLVYYWDVASDGTTWTEVATGIDEAFTCLDACCNAGYSNYFLWASYADLGDSLHVVRISNGGIDDIKLFGVIISHGLSIGAYDDRIMAVFEYLDDDIRYWISYDGGDNWGYGVLASTGTHYSNPEVTARKGGGFSVIYEAETGEPDTCYYRRRDYDMANWTAPKPFNEVDVSTGTPMCIEWVPPCYSYGSIWIGGGNTRAYFDRQAPWLCGDANGSGLVELGDVVYLITYLYKNGPAPVPLLSGDANCSGVVELGDVVYLITYLYKNGPAPPC